MEQPQQPQPTTQPLNPFVQDKGHRGNRLIKHKGVHIEWTPEMVEEYIRCQNDPIYFCERYMKIITLDKGIVPFKLYDYQRDIITTIHDNRKIIITAARQSGKTTSYVGYITWYILFNSEKNVAILANKAGTAREILSRIQFAYQHLPKWLQQGVVEWNKGSFILENHSRVLADSTTGDSIRGFAFNIVFIDEAAHIDGWDEFFQSVYPTLSSGESSKLILISTPFGLNHFYSIWMGAHKQPHEDGKNDYAAILVLWNQVPRRDENWRLETLSALNNDQAKFDVEYNCEFQGSSGTLIAGWKLKQLVSLPPIWQEEGLYQFEKPLPGHSYVMVADTSEGKGLDYSAFSVIDVTTMPYRQICVFRNNQITPYDYAGMLYRVGKTYNESSILIELNNNMGGQVLEVIYNNFLYDRILSTENMGRAGKRVSAGFGGSGKTELGVRTTTIVKNMGCSALKLLIEQNQLVVNDVHTIYELSRFVKKANSYKAETGVNDDIAMGLVLFAWLTMQDYFKELTDIYTIQKLRDVAEEQMIAQLTPFGFVDKGPTTDTYDKMKEGMQEWTGWTGAERPISWNEYPHSWFED